MSYKVTKDDHFSVGVWGPRNQGRDPFGAGVRPPLSVQQLIPMLAQRGVEGISFHDDDILDPTTSATAQKEVKRGLKKTLSDNGMRATMTTCNLFFNPEFRDGGFSSRRAGVRQLALQKSMRALEIGQEFNAPVFVFWGGREGSETDVGKDLRASYQWYADGINRMCEYAKYLNYSVLFAIEPKPNEPRGDIFLPTVGDVLAFIDKLDHNFREMVGVNPEVAHGKMAGLNFLHQVALAHWRGKLFHIDLNDQNPGRFDMDLSFGFENLAAAFNLVRFLRRVNYQRTKNIDAHALRTDDEKGVLDFLDANLETYKELEEKSARFDQDPDIQAVLAEMKERNGTDSFGMDQPLTPERIAALKAQPLNGESLAAQGYLDERLHTLTRKLLLGVSKN